MKITKTYTARQFAEAMGVSYRTVMQWLAGRIIPGAAKQQSPIGEWWEIPASALKMERPTRGPKPAKGGSKK